uniref:Outer membrane autotransporter barrel domain-containing protein n=1 Tax=Candidatus Kentrum sp. LFY TaxID=2126342 RepID=A0A450UR14_9GAMM|nr:MAG: outer membrane autotransporter barrel domain-containing protein [Candidatus Kentron sp. LFY]
MSSTLERKVFKNGVKPSRRIKKALVGGISVAATAAMLGMSGQAMAAVIDYQASQATATWGTGSHFSPTTAFNASNTNNLDLNGKKVVIDDTTDNFEVGTISTGAGTLEITTATDGVDVSLAIAAVDLEGVVGNIDINLLDVDNAAVAVNVAGSLKTAGYLKLTSTEITAAKNLTVTVAGDLKVGEASVIKGAAGTGVQSDATLKLGGASNEFTKGLTLDAQTPGAGKAIVEFTGSGAQAFTGDISGHAPGEGIISITGGGDVTFNGKVGDTTNQLYHVDLTNDTASEATTATFKESVAVAAAGGIFLGEMDSANINTNKVTFDASNLTGELIIDAKINGVTATDSTKEDLSDVVIMGSGKTVKQAVNKDWGATSPLTKLNTQNGVTFNSLSNITAKTVTIESGSTASFSEVVTAASKVDVQGTATFTKALAATAAVDVGASGVATFNAVNNVPGAGASTLDFASGSKIVLTGAANDSSAVVFGDDTGAVTVKSAGTVTIELGETGLTKGQYIILVDSSGTTALGAGGTFDATHFKVIDQDADIDFTVDNTTEGSQIRLLAGDPVKSTANQENLNTALTHVSQHIVQNVASTLSSRMDFKRFDNFRGSGSFKGYDKGISSGDAAGMGHSAWVKTFGNWIDQDDEGGISGYDADIYGLVVGMDTEVDKNIRAGVAFGYSNADVDGNGATEAKADIDHYQISVYGDYTDEKFYVEGMLGYARGENDTSDFINDTTRRTAKYDSDQYMASVGLGIPVYMGDDIFVTPKGSLTWIHLETDSYTLTGDNTKVNPDDVDSFVGEIGAEIHKKIKQEDGYIIPSAYAGVSYDFAGEEASATIGGTTIAKGIKNEEFAGNVGVGLTYEVGEWSVGAKYDGKFKSGQDSHAATLQARYQF